MALSSEAAAMTLPREQTTPPAEQNNNNGKKESRRNRKGKNPPTPPPPPKIWGTFDRHQFLSTESTGTPLDRLQREQRGAPEVSKEVGITEEVHGRYANFLEGHLAKLNRLRETNRAVYDRLVASNEHRYEDQLLRQVSEPDAFGNYVINKDKLNGFLANPEGWMIATQLLEQQTAYQFFAVGLHAALNPEGYKNILGRNDEILLGADQGPWSRFVYEHLDPYLHERIPRAGDRPATIADLHQTVTVWGRNIPLRIPAIQRIYALAGIAGGTVAGGLAGLEMTGGHPLGAAVGAAVVPLWVGLHELTKEGLEIMIQRCPGALQSLKGAANYPLERDYMKTLYQIDMDDLQVNQNRVELVDNRLHGTLRNVDNELRRELLGNVYTRLRFYEGLGVPPEQLDVLPEQFLYRYNDGNPEQTGAWWSGEILTEFDGLGGIQDTAGTRIDAAGFVRANVDFAGNLRRFREARAHVISRYFERIAAREQRQERRGNNITGLNAQIEARKNSTELKEKVQRPARERKEALEKRRNELPVLQNYETFETNRQRLGEIRHRVTDELNINIPPNQNVPQVLNAEIARLQGELYNPGPPPIGLRHELNTETANRDQQIITETNAALQDLVNRINQMDPRAQQRIPENMFNEAQSRVKQRVEALYRARIDRLEQEIREREENIRQFQDVRNEYNQAEAEMRKAERAIIAEAPKNLAELDNAYNQMVTAVAGQPGAITSDMLRGETVDRLVERLTQPPYNLPAGTEEQRETLRQTVLRAKAENRARAEEAVEPSPQNQLQTYNYILSIPGGTITSDQMVTLSDEEIENRLSQAPYPAVVGANRQQIRQYIQSEARKRLRIRHREYVEEQRSYLDARIAQEEKLMQVDFGQQISQLEAARAALERQGQAFDKSGDIFAEPDRYLNPDSITKGNLEYTEAERTAGVPQGYTELLNVIFNYQATGTEREELFKVYERILPPKKMAVLLNDTLNLGLAGAQRRNLRTVLTTLRNRVTGAAAPRIMPIDIQEGLQAVINNLVAEARALS